MLPAIVGPVRASSTQRPRAAGPIEPRAPPRSVAPRLRRLLGTGWRGGTVPRVPRVPWVRGGWYGTHTTPGALWEGRRTSPPPLPSRSPAEAGSLSEALKGFCNRQPASWPPPLGRPCLPRPHPIVRAASCPSSTGCSRGLHVRQEHSSSVPSARPFGAAEGASSSVPSSLARSRWAPGQARAILVRHRQFSCLAPKGAVRRASSSSLSPGGALPLPDPPPIVRTAEAVLPPLFVVGA